MKDRLIRGACLLAGLFVLSCSPADERPPCVILICIDTLRADHLGCHGYERDTTPVLDALAATADFHTRVRATSPWTLPSHASFFTGRFPFQHGARTFDARHAVENASPLPAVETTLAEVLREAGYATAAFAANDAYLAPRWRLDQGFDLYHVERETATAMHRRILPWLTEHAGGEPFFLFINYMDTHRPYHAPPRPDFLPTPSTRDSGLLIDRIEAAVAPGPGRGQVPEQLVSDLVDLYDLSLRHLDEELGRLFARLRELDIWDRALVVVTSDHGEYFGEHFLVEHSKDVYEEAVHVPQIVKRPGQTEGRRLDEATSGAFLPSLILRETGLAPPAELAAFLGPDTAARPVIVENHYSRVKDLQDKRWRGRFNRVRQCLYEWPWKYIHSSDGAHELYHLADDPGERRNRIGEQVERATGMARRLLDILERDAGPPYEFEEQQLSDEELQRLRSLGYVGE